MEETYFLWITRRESRGLLWATLLFLLGGCSVVPNSQEGNGEEEGVNQAFRGSEAASASRGQMKAKAKVDEGVQQEVQATKVRQAHTREEFEESQGGGVQGPCLFTRSNTASPFVTEPEEHDLQLFLSSEEENVSTPQEILDRKFRDPGVVLTPNQSITLLNHCTELGEQSAATAAEQTVSIFMGNTGAGKSTTLNALLGCRMKAVKPRELGLPGTQRIIIVDPESPRKEVMPIGHGGRQSQTFMPQIVQDPNNPRSAYCDCPGFYDTRGAEINIANAINITKILKQATGVKAVFLASYGGLLEDRGRSIQDLEAMCGKMFGGANNLRKYQDSVLLGITKAPLYEDDEPLTRNSVRELLTSTNSDIATILANRIFLFDPLDRAVANPDFWSLARCRTEIAQLEYIPQQQAVHLFQTTLTASDKAHLLTTVRQLQPQIISAIEQGDVTSLGQHWQLLQRLRVVEHPEVHQIIEGQVFPAVNMAIFQKAEEVKDSASAFDFDDAQQKLSALTDIIRQIPGVPLLCNVNELRRHVNNCQANKDNEEARQENLAALREALAAAHRRIALVREQLDRTSNER